MAPLPNKRHTYGLGQPGMRDDSISLALLGDTGNLPVPDDVTAGAESDLRLELTLTIEPNTGFRRCCETQNRAVAA